MADSQHVALDKQQTASQGTSEIEMQDMQPQLSQAPREEPQEPQEPDTATDSTRATAELEADREANIAAVDARKREDATGALEASVREPHQEPDANRVPFSRLDEAIHQPDFAPEGFPQEARANLASNNPYQAASPSAGANVHDKRKTSTVPSNNDPEAQEQRPSIPLPAPLTQPRPAPHLTVPITGLSTGVIPVPTMVQSPAVAPAPVPPQYNDKIHCLRHSFFGKGLLSVPNGSELITPGQVCPICMERYANDGTALSGLRTSRHMPLENAMQIRRCGHVFHKSCLRGLIQGFCPSCGAKLYKRSAWQWFVEVSKAVGRFCIARSPRRY